MLRVVPQDWEPKSWPEKLTARLAREMARLRDPWSAQSLSDRTDELGWRVSRSVITDIENGRRKYVAVHELIVLAEALSISPLELLFGEDNAAKIEYLPDDEVMRLVAVQRFSGIDEDILRRYEDTMRLLDSLAENMREASARLSELLDDSRRPGGMESDGGG